MNLKDLKNPPKKYRPAPFWSWNDKLETEETRRQVRLMDKAGLGGYFMHARGGLKTEYLSDEWYDNILAAVEEGEKSEMLSWGYDENGWPSGFGGGLVNGLGEEYQQKYLRCSITAAPQNTPRTIINIERNGENLHFYYEVNPFYVDTLSAKVIAEFIRVTHKAYKDVLGDNFAKMKGFFTDEPQISRSGFPWSLVLEREYKARHGEELAPLLPALFFDEGDFRRVRYNYWALVRDLFSENFMKQIGDWCRQNGSALTGHLVIEESFAHQIITNGACMPHYEYMDIPGMDHLGRFVADLQTIVQLCSAAAQLGKKQILSETFALSGWNVSFEDLRNIYENQMVHGVNYLCQHLEGYSLRGIRKRDYPASLFAHQPWWNDYSAFNDGVSRIGMLISMGEVRGDVLLLHSIESGWTSLKDNLTYGKYTDIDSTEANKWCDRLYEVMMVLEKAHVQYHLGDDRLMARHGKIENGKFVIGRQSYSVVVVPPATTLGKAALTLLKEFKAAGGNIIFVDTVPSYVAGVKNDGFKDVADTVVALERLKEALPASVCRAGVANSGGEDAFVNLLVRYFDDRTVYYLHNQHCQGQELCLDLPHKSALIYDPFDHREIPADYTLQGDGIRVTANIEGHGSLVVFGFNDNQAPACTSAPRRLKAINGKLKGEWQITSDEDNILTLDYCDLYFDGECAGKNIPIGDVQELALAFGRSVNTRLVFGFKVKEKAFTRLKLAVETPEIFTIEVNGRPVDKRVVGYLHDKAFCLIDIAPFVKEGGNEIALTCDFLQSDRVYDMAAKSLIYESEKNKLFYDMELEAVYLAGDFGVESDRPFTSVDNRGLATKGKFALTAERKRVDDGPIAQQGYPFFAGSMTFKKTVNLTAEEAGVAAITFSRLCSNVTEVKVNGRLAGRVMWQPYEVDISPFALEGENTIEITVKGNLRNMLGPFHLAEGECLSVGPGAFLKNSPLWNKGSAGSVSKWVDSYCFVEFGLFFNT